MCQTLQNCGIAVKNAFMWFWRMLCYCCWSGLTCFCNCCLRCWNCCCGGQVQIPRVHTKDIQLYCKRNDQLASDVCKDLKDRLSRQGFFLQEITVVGLDNDMPTILVSFKITRPLADVSEATNEIKDKFNSKMVLLILHITPDDPVVDGSSELVKGYVEYSPLGHILDMGYQNKEGRYCLNKNSYALNELANFCTK